MKLQIIDEKSLIKKYQNEIRCLKEELEQLKRGIVTVPQLKDIGEDNIVLLKQKVSIPLDGLAFAMVEKLIYCSFACKSCLLGYLKNFLCKSWSPYFMLPKRLHMLYEEETILMILSKSNMVKISEEFLGLYDIINFNF